MKSLQYFATLLLITQIILSKEETSSRQNSNSQKSETSISNKENEDIETRKDNENQIVSPVSEIDIQNLKQIEDKLNNILDLDKDFDVDEINGK